MKISVGKKIGLGFLVMLVFIVIFIIATFSTLQNTKNDLEEISKANERSNLSLESNLYFREATSAIRGYIAYGDEQYYAQMEENISKALEKEHELLNKARPEKRQEVQNLIDATTKYKDGMITELAPEIRLYTTENASGNTETALYHKERINKIGASLVPITGEVTTLVDQISINNKKVITERINTAVTEGNRVIIIFLFLGLIAGIIGVALAIIIPKTIRDPITAMLDGTKSFANGDLRAPIDVASADELGDLAAALNSMRASMRSIIHEILQSAEQVAASSEELNASADQSAESVSEVAGAIMEVATGSQQQLAAVSESSIAINQMSKDIQQVVANVQLASNLSEQTATAANCGTEAITLAVSQMESIEKTVIESAGVVEKLGERSKEIGQIVDTISGIAGQTNLLALNAAIEAARAGEQGRGFAVVADEVRKLAEQSQEAAKQIADLISEIQIDTDTAVGAMQAGTREVKTGTEVVSTAGDAFDEVVKSVNKVAGQIRRIAATMQQMETGSQTVVVSVTEIAAVSDNTAKQTQNISAVVEEQCASMEEIAASSQALAKLAEELQGAVNKFEL